MSAYLLLGLLTLLDLQSVVVSLVVSCGLSGTCTGPGGFETETLGMTLLLLPDPVGLWGMSFSWMTGCGFGTFTLGILGEGGGTGGGSAGCGSLGGMATTISFSRPVASVLGVVYHILDAQLMAHQRDVKFLSLWTHRNTPKTPLL